MYDALKQMMFDYCRKCGMVKQINQSGTNVKTQKNIYKPWFDQECKNMRAEYNRQRNNYVNHKSDQHLDNMKIASRRYKATNRKAEKKYRKQMIKQLKTNNSKKY